MVLREKLNLKGMNLTKPKAYVVPLALEGSNLSEGQIPK